jgi:hypothetical protein
MVRESLFTMDAECGEAFFDGGKGCTSEIKSYEGI